METGMSDDQGAPTLSEEEAPAGLSGLLQRVAAGESVTITSHGEPVARLVPVPKDDTAERQRRREALDTLFRRIEQQPALNLGTFQRDWAYDD